MIFPTLRSALVLWLNVSNEKRETDDVFERRATEGIQGLSVTAGELGPTPPTDVRRSWN